MTPIQEIRLTLASQLEEFATAAMHLREAESYPPEIAGDCLTDAAEAIENLLENLRRIQSQVQNIRLTLAPN